MSRLIDANKLIENMCKSCDNEACGGLGNNSTAKCFPIWMIEEQPTAYDVDKVVEELKENIENIEDENGTHHFVIDSFTAEYIVKEGGVHEK